MPSKRKKVIVDGKEISSAAFDALLALRSIRIGAKSPKKDCESSGNNDHTPTRDVELEWAGIEKRIDSRRGKLLKEPGQKATLYLKSEGNDDAYKRLLAQLERDCVDVEVDPTLADRLGLLGPKSIITKYQKQMSKEKFFPEIVQSIQLDS